MCSLRSAVLVHGERHLAASISHAPCASTTVVYVPGLGSVRCGEKSAAFEALARRQSAGFVSFDPYGQGQSNGAMREVTISGCAEDVDHVVQCARKMTLGETGRVVLVAASLGALAAAICAARRGLEMVQGLVMIGPAVDFAKRVELYARNEDGDVVITSEYAGEMVLDKMVLEDAKMVQGLWGEEKLASALRLAQVPVVCAHGTLDEVVPVENVRRFMEVVGPKGKLLEFENGDHRLNKQVGEIIEAVVQAGIFPPSDDIV